ncbi:hypothetical protein ACV36C_37790, partial [Pseudomonas aeruginosa]
AQAHRLALDGDFREQFNDKLHGGLYCQNYEGKGFTMYMRLIKPTGLPNVLSIAFAAQSISLSGEPRCTKPHMRAMICQTRSARIGSGATVHMMM